MEIELVTGFSSLSGPQQGFLFAKIHFVSCVAVMWTIKNTILLNCDIWYTTTFKSSTRFSNRHHRWVVNDDLNWLVSSTKEPFTPKSLNLICKSAIHTSIARPFVQKCPHVSCLKQRWNKYDVRTQDVTGSGWRVLSVQRRETNDEFRHLGSSTAANWVSFDLNVSCSSCWGYSLINTLKF